MAIDTTVRRRPPTEAEIRAAYHDRQMPRYDPLSRLGDDLYAEVVPFADPFRWLPADDTGASELGDAIWTDLRPSEAADLEAGLDYALTIAVGKCMDLLEEEIVAAVVAFAAAHPDAKRSSRVTGS